MDDLCRSLFSAAQDPTHKLHSLLPTEKTITHNQIIAFKYPLSKVKTKGLKIRLSTTLYLISSGDMVCLLVK